MKTSLLCALGLATVMAASAADSKEDLEKAVKELAGKANYSWKSTIAVPEGSGNRFRMGPTEGQAEKDGLVHVTMTMGKTKRKWRFRAKRRPSWARMGNGDPPKN